MSKKINTLSIDTTDIPQSGQRRQFTITGDADAKFMVIISSETTYYNFVSRTFQTTSNAQTVLKGSLPQGGRFSSRVVFPSGSGVNYNIMVMADPTDDTVVNGDVLNERVSQVADTTVTFALASTANSINYKTFPSSVTVTSIPTGSVAANIDWNIENAETDAGGFGLLIDNDFGVHPNTQLMTQAVYFTNTTTVDGATTSSTEVVVDSLTQIAVGSVITGVSSGSLSGTPSVIAIDTNSKTLTLSSAQTFADGITLTFKTYGKNAFKSAGITGSVVSDFVVTPADRIEKLVGAGSSGETINLNGTYGVGFGAQFTGPGVDPAGNRVVEVIPSETAGSIIANGSQNLVPKILLRFSSIDTSKTLCNASRFVGSIQVVGSPPIDTTIYIDVDLLLTPLTDS